MCAGGQGCNEFVFRSGARAERSPPPSRRAASSTARSLRRVGPKISNAASVAPATSEATATMLSVGANWLRMNENGASSHPTTTPCR